MGKNFLPPSGFPEFPPAAEFLRQKWIRIIAEIFEKNGFAPIGTPAVERAENLLAKGGDEKEIYFLQRAAGENDGAARALRFDHTVPLALFVARNLNEINFPFRRYSIGPVFRGERAQSGRFRQFDQCDIDIVGRKNLPLICDAEMPAIIIEIFQKLQIGDFFVRINNRKIFQNLFQNLKIPEKKFGKILKIIDEIEKIEKNCAAKFLKNCEKILAKNFNFKNGKNDENSQKILKNKNLSDEKKMEKIAEFLNSKKKIDAEILTKKFKIEKKIAEKILENFAKNSAEKIILEKFAAEKIEKNAAEKILNFTKISGTNDEILAEMKKISREKNFCAAVAELEKTVFWLRKMADEKFFRIDPKIARGLDYYTGTIFETALVGAENLGSICSGGRYENLTSIFLKKKFPGVGISIGLTRLLSHFFKKNWPTKISPTKILILPTDEKFWPQSLQLAQKIRAQKIPTEIFFEKKNLKKKLEWANKKKIPAVALLGENEIAGQFLTLKNLRTGAQQKIFFAEIKKIAEFF